MQYMKEAISRKDRSCLPFWYSSDFSFKRVLYLY